MAMANDKESERSHDSNTFDSLYEKAGRAAVQAEKLYHDLNVGKRLTGAGLGLKAGFLVGRFAGPHGAIAGPVIGAVLGATYGPEGIERAKAAFDKALDRFKPERLPAPEQDLEDPLDKQFPHRIDLTRKL